MPPGSAGILPAPGRPRRPRSQVRPRRIRQPLPAAGYVELTVSYQSVANACWMGG